jgi:hypothetical protein
LLADADPAAAGSLGLDLSNDPDGPRVEVDLGPTETDKLARSSAEREGEPPNRREAVDVGGGEEAPRLGARPRPLAGLRLAAWGSVEVRGRALRHPPEPDGVPESLRQGPVDVADGRARERSTLASTFTREVGVELRDPLRS